MEIIENTFRASIFRQLIADITAKIRAKLIMIRYEAIDFIDDILVSCVHESYF